MSASNIPLLTGAILLTETAAANAAVAAKASSAVLYELELDNTANAAAATFVKLWNTAAASVVVGTTAPDMIIILPAATKITLVFPSGVTFGTALSYAAVTTAGTAGTTSPVSSVPIKLVYV